MEFLKLIKSKAKSFYYDNFTLVMLVGIFSSILIPLWLALYIFPPKESVRFCSTNKAEIEKKLKEGYDYHEGNGHVTCVIKYVDKSLTETKEK